MNNWFFNSYINKNDSTTINFVSQTYRMQDLKLNIQLQLNENLYLKHPESSELGKRIIKAGIDMIYEMGYEDFNFRKLAKRIKTSEASIYRYFESKVKMLLYLSN